VGPLPLHIDLLSSKIYSFLQHVYLVSCVGTFVVDQLVVESKDVELKASIVDNENGTFTVSYVHTDSNLLQFALSVLLNSEHICGSPFTVSARSYRWKPGRKYLTLTNDNKTFEVKNM
jgi:hypothetical protein